MKYFSDESFQELTNRKLEEIACQKYIKYQQVKDLRRRRRIVNIEKNRQLEPLKDKSQKGKNNKKKKSLLTENKPKDGKNSQMSILLIIYDTKINGI